MKITQRTTGQMAKIRLTQRRTMLSDARDRNADKVAAAILPIFQKQFKHIQKTVIRTGGNLRRKMGKMKVPGDCTKEQDALYRSIILTKADPPQPAQYAPAFPPPPAPAQPDTSWDTFKAALVAALLFSLGNAADDIGGVEGEVWQSRGYSQLQFDPDQVVQDYQSRIGRNISNIPDDTLTAVQGAIASWYTSDAPFSDLIDELGKYFDGNRAKLIANTEVGNLTSQVTLQAMKFFGLVDGTYDEILDERTCQFCEDIHGTDYHVGDPMPPHHPDCRGTISFSPEPPDVTQK